MNALHKSMILGISLVSVLLSGCATTSPAERSAQMERRVDEIMQVYGPACDKLGYAKESNEWRNCVMDMANQEEIKAYIRLYGYAPYPASPYYGSPRYFYRW